MAESRVKKSLLNAKVNLIFYVLTLALSFFSRKIFLDCLGADFVGLTGTLQNLLGFLNLAELGIGSAIGYVLYKPLFEENHQQINEIISVFAYLYRWIGWIILILGSILACFLPLIFPNTGFEPGVIYATYSAFLASSLIGYFINYKQTLLGADQKNYIITGCFQSTNIIKVLIQMASAWYTRSYYLWVAIELIFGVIYSFILNWKISQVYPWLKTEKTLKSKQTDSGKRIIKYTRQLFIHKMAGFVQFQSRPLLIYAFTSLSTVASYQNYTIIIDKISGFINSILGSTNASIGNLIAEGNKQNIKHVYWELFSIRMLIAGVTCSSLYYLTEPFIQLWVGNQYILNKNILLLTILYSFFSYTRNVNDDFIYGYGLFWDTWSPVSEIIINLSVSIIGGMIWGLEGVLLGGIISTFIVIGGWKSYLLYHWGFKESVSEYWIKYNKFVILIIIPIPIINIFINHILITPASINFKSWILHALTISTIYTIISYTLFYIFLPETKRFTKRLVIHLKTKK